MHLEFQTDKTRTGKAANPIEKWLNYNMFKVTRIWLIYDKKNSCKYSIKIMVDGTKTELCKWLKFFFLFLHMIFVKKLSDTYVCETARDGD